MNINPTVPKDTDASRRFHSLEFCQDFSLPQPINEAHKLQLWYVAANAGSILTESAIVGKTVHTLSRRAESGSRESTLALVKNSLVDLVGDKLLIHDGTGMFSCSVIGNAINTPLSQAHRFKTRTLRLSGFGYQIAAESARRELHDPKISKPTLKHVEEVYRRSTSAMLISGTNLPLPHPL
ncbi:hypothetical protein BH10PAT3_BH10PAT3_3240 [soil metagenome]